MSKTDPRKYRQRKKHLYNAIREQMEFYFSDSNLSKDRFMSEALKLDEYIPIETFLRFNKILALTKTSDDIVQAINNSEILELDKEKTKVKRNTEIKIKENVEDFTIYVESLPPTADHDWIKKIFSVYGPIAYISLPKYAKSRKIKEFAFIEYMKKSSVKKALQAFQEFNSVLSYEDMEPANLKSVVAYVKEQNADDTTEADSADGSDEDDESNESGNEDEKEVGTVEKGVDEDVKHSEPEDELQPPAKKQKLEAKEETVDGGEEVADDSKDTTIVENEDDKKKRRRRKKTCASKESIMDNRWKDVKIMAKKDWKRLRNKYLDTQRKKFKEIKKQLMLGRRKEEPNKKKIVPIKKVTSPQNMNFYGAQTEPVTVHEPVCAPVKEVNKAMLQKPLFSFEPGLIVNIKFRESCVDVKDFKDELRQFSYVKYIDVKEGDMETFVRVENCKFANLLVKQYSSADYQSAHVLSGELETQYWDKILKDRENKLNKTVKVKQCRGREKIIKKAAVHIHFEEDE